MSKLKLSPDTYENKIHEKYSAKTPPFSAHMKENRLNICILSRI